LYAHTSQALARGNDFGNAGDAIREVFNAGRTFASDAAGSLKMEDLETSLAADELSAYMTYRTDLKHHINSSDHHWGPTGHSDRCARIELSDSTVIELSYKLCSEEVGNAVAAMPLLIAESWRAVASIKDFNYADHIAQQMTEVWSKKFPISAAKAATFKVNGFVITGMWDCITSSNLLFRAEVREDGIIQLKWPIAVQSQRDQVDFLNFIRLDRNRTSFEATGYLRLPRGQQPSHSNIVYDDFCTHTYTVRLDQGQEGDSLTLDLRLKSVDKEFCSVKTLPVAAKATCRGKL